MVYDPVKAHEYYERTKQLKGKNKAGSSLPKAKTSSTPAMGKSDPGDSKSTKAAREAAIAKVARLKGKVTTLEGALTKANVALSAKRRSAAKEEKANSDGKSTAKEKQAAEEYREKHREELKAKESARRESGGSKSSSSSTSKSEVTVESLEARVSKIKSALRLARSQLSSANQALGQLAHSALTTEPLVHTQTLQPKLSRKESVTMKADFGGYATRSDIQCADGRTILPGAFADHDGLVVPLVYQHDHKDLDNVLGHCKLEAREDGVYAHAFFNETARGQNAKMQVQHGDIKFLSIFANGLEETIRDRARGFKDVVKGKIREVSLVLAGANPGAYIDHVNMVHSDGVLEMGDEAIITTGLEIELSHAAPVDDSETIEDVLKTLNEKQLAAVTDLLHQAFQAEPDVTHSDTDGAAVGSDDAASDTETGDEPGDGTETGEESGDGDEPATEETDESAEEGSDTNTETGTDTGTDAGDEAQHDNTHSQEDNSMTHNVFDQAKNSSAGARTQVKLSHDALNDIVRDAKKNGSLKDALEGYLEHTGITVNGELKHGIENIEYLFPDSKLLENSPAFISRRMEWVDKVLSTVRKSPFSRIKTITADITPDEARARGYIKGNMKNEEFFALSKRETTPQTVYKKQKLDRDDVLDITDLDVVAWLKAEMKVMLDEEIAAAILVGDGRSVGDDDKIKETNIRPIASDAELYVTTAYVNLDDASSSIEELVDAVIDNRQYYKGTGQPTFYTTEGVISRFLTVKDNFGRRIYASLAEVAAVLRVSDIVPVEVMERVPDLVGIMVNLADYTLGADKGGQATMFDDFDINYNKLLYLIETRLSGALTQPKSALVFRKTEAASALVVPTEPTFEDNVVTVPTVTGVVYKNGDTDATLTTGAPVTLDVDESLYVKAVPAAGKHFANNQNDEWTYEHQA
jgi:HK97 family phage prohead protease